MTYRERLLARKERIGNRASYMKIAYRVGRSHTAVRNAMLGIQGDIPIDNDTLLRKIDRALSEIESESGFSLANA